MTDTVGSQPKRKIRTPEERKAALQAELAALEAKERERSQARLATLNKKLADLKSRADKLDVQITELNEERLQLQLQLMPPASGGTSDE